MNATTKKSYMQREHKKIAIKHMRKQREAEGKRQYIYEVSEEMM